MNLEPIMFKLNNDPSKARVNKMIKTEGRFVEPSEYFERYLKPRFTDKSDLSQFLVDITYVLKKGKELGQFVYFLPD